MSTPNKHTASLEPDSQPPSPGPMSQTSIPGPISRSSNPGPISRENVPRVSLDALPDKVLKAIAVELEHGKLTVRPDGRYPATVTNEMNRQGREALKNLCLVSKKFARIAQPSLWRLISVSKPSVLVCLYRSVEENERLGDLVHTLVFEVAAHLGDSRWFEFDITSLSQQQRSSMAKDDEERFTVKSITEDQKTACFLYFEILKRTPNLESLYINVQHVSLESDPYYPKMVLGNSIYPLAIKVRNATQPDWVKSKGVGQILTKLRKLVVLGNPSLSYAPLSAPIVDLFVWLPGLEELTCFRDDGNWFLYDWVWRQAYSHNQPRETITSIQLEDSACLPSDIYYLCTLFPGLKSLSITTNAKRASERNKTFGKRVYNSDNVDHQYKVYLSEGLELLKDLERLTLDLRYLFDPREELSVNGVLELTMLTKLREVYAPVKFFIPPPTDGPPCPPEVTMPPNLEYLTLWADEAYDINLLLDWDIDYSFRIKREVIDFLSAVSGIAGPSGYLPSLQEVCFLSRSGTTGRPADDPAHDLATGSLSARLAVSMAVRLLRLDGGQEDLAMLMRLFRLKNVWFVSMGDVMITPEWFH